MIKLATVFSGIGAIEHALRRMGIEYKIVFACDNGDVDILSKKIGDNINEIKEELKILKDKLDKENEDEFKENLNKCENKLENVIRKIGVIKEKKIGSGHGEAKLYVGNEGEKVFNFFEEFNNECYFLKEDFKNYLKEAQQEYYDPQQKYIKISDMQERYKKYNNEINNISEETLNFKLYRVGVKPPRVYVNSKSEYWEIVKKIALPNISYLSVLKLKENIIKSRIGQGKYRERLLNECMYCPFTMVSDERLLIASHIKPWSESSNKEKTDPKNGFMLTPTYDFLFDRGFITFDDDKKLIVSCWISLQNQKRLNIKTGKLIERLPLDEKRKKYLKYHREHVFKA